MVNKISLACLGEFCNNTQDVIRHRHRQDFQYRLSWQKNNAISSLPVFGQILGIWLKLNRLRG